jgi:hypothetical protein
LHFYKKKCSVDRDFSGNVASGGVENENSLLDMDMHTQIQFGSFLLLFLCCCCCYVTQTRLKGRCYGATTKSFARIINVAEKKLRYAFANNSGGATQIKGKPYCM